MTETQLNELVQLHIRRLIDRSPSNAIDYLREHFSELLSTGMLTLSNRLASVSDEQLLKRLEQVWTFFCAITSHACSRAFGSYSHSHQRALLS